MEKSVFSSWRVGLGLGLVVTFATLRDDLSSWFVHSLQPAVRPETILVMALLSGAMVLLGQALQMAFMRGVSVSWGASRISQSWLWAPMMALAGAAMAEPAGGVSPSTLLVPFVLTAIVLAVMALSRRPSIRWTRELMLGLSLFRWYYLGGLLGTASSKPWLSPSAEDLIVYAVIFLALHQATRKVRRVDRARFPSGLDSLVATYDSLSVGILVELCLILPLSLFLGAGSRLSLVDCLPSYLALMTANALLLKWTVEGPNPTPKGYERLVGSVSRVFAVSVAFIWISALIARPPDPGFVPALTILLTMGLLRGRPWGSQPSRRLPPDFPEAVVPNSAAPLGRRFWQATGAALLCLGIALVSLKLPSDHCQSGPLLNAHYNLRATSGWRFRLQPTTEGSAILAYQRGLMWDSWTSQKEISRAEAAVRQAWPQVRLVLVEVRPGVWEALAEALFLTFALVQFAVLGIIFGKIQPPEARLWSRGLLVTAGFFGALGMASAWGWLWLNSHLLFLGFACLTFMSCWTPRTLASHGNESLESLRACWQQIRSLPHRERPNTLEVTLGRNLWELSTGLQEKVRETAESLGIPTVIARVVHDDRGAPDQYKISHGPRELGRGTLYPDSRLLVGPASRVAPFGTPFAEPTHGMPAVWVHPLQEAANQPVEGCRWIEPRKVLAEHLAHLCQQSGSHFLNETAVEAILERWEAELPSQVLPVRRNYDVCQLLDIFRGLLEDGVSLRDRRAILAALAGPSVDSREGLVKCRHALRHEFCARYADGSGIISAVVIPRISSDRRDLASRAVEALEQGFESGYHPILLVPAARVDAMRDALQAHWENPPAVLTTEELSERFRLKIVGTV